MLSVLALAARQIKQGWFSEYMIINEFHVTQSSIEGLAKKLTVTRTLGMRYSLVSNMKAGTQCLLDQSLTFYWAPVSRNGKASTEDIRHALGMYLVRDSYIPCSLVALVALHQLINEVNKVKRLLFPYSLLLQDNTTCRYTVAMGHSTLAATLNLRLTTTSFGGNAIVGP